MRPILFFLAACGLLLASCGRPAGTSSGAPLPVATLLPTPTGAPPPTDPPAAPTEPPADSGWVAAAPGAELRHLRADLGDGLAASIHVVRLDPALMRFQVGYAPDRPRSVATWADDTGAVAIINGGFFDEQNQTVSLLVLGGQRVGDSYSGRGGMFAVSPEGSVSLRGLAAAPYDPAEPLAEALQGWPLLVEAGGAPAYQFEDGERARRSALAIDREGRVLLIACPSSAFTLAGLALWLSASDLGVDAAVNLDGGSSTGLLLAGEGTSDRVDAFVPLPIVLMAMPKT